LGESIPSQAQVIAHGERGQDKAVLAAHPSIAARHFRPRAPRLGAGLALGACC
jgi:hypothetical protein